MLPTAAARPQASVLIVCWCALLAGCGRDGGQKTRSASPAPSFSESLKIVGTSDGQALEFGGVRFETPSSSSENPNSISTRNSNLTFTAGGISGTFKGGILTVEGEPYGLIDRGDVVKLSKDGSVSVNGKIREKLILKTSTMNGIRFSHYGNLYKNFHLSSDDGTVVIDGKSYGKLKKGDEFTQEIDGTILVNGEVRPPQ